MEQSGLGRGHRDAHRLRSFLHRAFLQLLHLNYLAQSRPQAVNGILQNSFLFVLCVTPFRIRRTIRYVVNFTIRAKIVGTCNCDLAPGSFLAQAHELRINCDSCQPSRKARPAVKVTKVNKCSKQFILNCVFGIFTISSYPMRRAQELRSMSLAECREGRRLPRLGSLYEIPFRRFLSFRCRAASLSVSI